MQKTDLTLNDDATVSGLAYSLFLKEALETQAPRIEMVTWATDSRIEKLANEPDVKHYYKGFGQDESILLHREGVMIHLSKNRTTLYARLAGSDPKEMKRQVTWLKRRFPKMTETREDFVPINFWSQTPNGPTSTTRKIEVPNWDDIVGNYPVDTRDKLAHQMREFVPTHGGQLVIWEGKPGTGKTYALRALANDWRDWADFHYVTDPESFFGDANYMMQVLLKNADDNWFDDDDDESDQKFNVLILEDCGELLAHDAKQQTGQAVARLLNVVDGLIGQGLRVLILVTTNEPVKTFHEAITRPGRCALQIAYTSFSRSEAIAWAKGQDFELKDAEKDSWTLAELFAEREGFTEKRSKGKSNSFGFGFVEDEDLTGVGSPS